MGKYLRYFYIHLIIILSVFAAGSSLYAQQDSNAVKNVRPVDTMFKEARLKAFAGHKDTAKLIIDSILKRTPDYNDVKVFLARINTWQQKYDTASIILNEVLASDPKNQEAIDAFIDLNYWTDHQDIAMAYADKGLAVNDKSDRFHYKKAKIFVYQKKPDDALWLLDTFIKYTPDTAANHQSRFYRDSVLNATYKRSVDEMFLDARNKAFTGHRDTARLIIDSIYKRSPNYLDVRVFEARLNTWDHKYDTAERTLRWVLSKDSNNTEAMSALFDLKYWGDHPREAESFADMYIRVEPKSDEFHVKKAKAQVDQKNYKGAADMLDAFIATHKDSSELSKAYRRKLREEMVHNSLTLSYDIDVFNDHEDMTLNKAFTKNNNFSEPWHLVSIYYDRQTKFGSVIARINYGNRFNSYNGVQYEMDAYPTIAKSTYMYLNAGYSDALVVFPKYRWGASIYRNLPWAFEAELGIRVLYFAPNLGPVRIFTGSIGKYYGNFWFSVRPYIIPSDYISYGYVSKSFQFIARYYLSGDPDHYLSASYSRGFSLDDHSKDFVLIQQDYTKNGTLPSYKIRMAYQCKIASRTFLNVRASYEEDKLFYGKFRNDWSAGFSIERRF